MTESDKIFRNKALRMMKDAREPKPTRLGKSDVPPRFLQLKVTLQETNVWRRIIVPNFFSLYDLHLVLQIVMGWSNSHLAQFIVGKRQHETFYSCYADDDMYGCDEGKDAAKYDLKYLTEKKMKFLYEYDFGDSWIHEIVVEKIDADYNGDVPVVLDGKLMSPPEDCGGCWESSDLGEFSVDEVNAELVDYFNPKPKKKAVKKSAKKKVEKKTAKKKVKKAWLFASRTGNGTK